MASSNDANDPASELDPLVIYDGRWMPASHASELHQEAVTRRRDSGQAQPPDSAKPDPGAEWNHEQLSLDQRFKVFWKEDDEVESKLDAERERLAHWGFSGPIDMTNRQEGEFTFDEFLPHSGYTYEAWFLRFLRAGGYPADLLAKRVITHAGYAALVAKKLDERSTRDVERKKKKSPAAGDPVPEPIPRRLPRKRKAPKKKI